MTRARLVLVIGLVACSTPTPQLALGFSSGPVQACPSTRCQDLPLPCDAVLSIRIKDPGPGGEVHLPQCVRVSPNNTHDMCSLKSVNLDSMPLPVHDLEVQVAVYPLSSLSVDAKGEPVCPDIEYSSATGFPVGQAPAPAFGGRAYYHPGDTQVTVTLGCTDLSSVMGNLTCNQSADGSLAVTVEDFDNRLPVTGGPGGLAEDLLVSVGEPRQLNGAYSLKPRDAIPVRLEDGEAPQWTAPATPSFNQHACVEVLEDAPQAVATLRCTAAADPLPELSGVWVSRDRVSRILSQLAMSSFPDQGLTIGLVVDKLSIGAPGYVVTASAGSVTYLSSSGVVGGSATSDNGIFVSTDAPFGTLFSASGANRTLSAVGGRVAGKITVVIVSFAP